MTAAPHRPVLSAKRSLPQTQIAYAIGVPLGANGSADVEIRISPRRTRYAQAHLEEGKVVVVMPPGLSEHERTSLATKLTRRLLSSSRAAALGSNSDLERRAHELADTYLEGTRPTSIRWVENQMRRWGSCTPSTGAIRLSSRLSAMPSWVVDGVIVHELAHLLEPSHSTRFRALVGRYPRLAEAEAFLLGFEHGASTGRSSPQGCSSPQGW